MLRLSLLILAMAFAPGAAHAVQASVYLQAVQTAEACTDTRLTLIEEQRLSDLIKLNADENATLLATTSQLQQLRREPGVSCSTDAAEDSLSFFATEVAPYLGQPVYRSPIPLS